MDIREKQHIKNYLSNINANLMVAGYNNVGHNWRDMDYTPDYNKFYYICSGEGWLRIDGGEYFPKPGQLFLLPQGIKQSFSTISQNTFTKYWCHFTAKVGDVNIFDIIKLPYSVDVGNNETLLGIFNEMLEGYKSVELSSSLVLKSSILKLIAFYLDNSTVEKVNISGSETTEKLNIVLDYIEKNYDKNITVEELSKIAYLHPNYFIRFFKKNVGTSPIHYINKRRIEEAKKLLTSTSLTLAAISSKIGTNDIYYLSKLFKDYTGFSPSAYKSMMQQ